MRDVFFMPRTSRKNIYLPEIRPQQGAARFMPQLADSFFLYLSHALTVQVKFLRYLLQRHRIVSCKTHHPALLYPCMYNALANPTYGIRNKFKAAGFIKTLCRFYKSHVTFVNQVGQAKPFVLVLLGNRNNKTQVGFGKLIKRGLVTLADAYGQRYFFFSRY